jgi:SM-20-related protein
MQFGDFTVNQKLDRSTLSREFESNGRVQVRDILSAETAAMLANMLEQQTDWGIAWQNGEDGPNYHKAAAANPADLEALTAIQSASYGTMKDQGYAFQFGSYPMLKAYLERWKPGSIHDYVFEHLNDAPFLNLVREITKIGELKKADAQATLYAPGHFLAQHDDSHVGQGWRVAYVLNLCPVDWRPDWGGYLNFLNEDGDIVAGWRPRFNTLNLFSVPQKHLVSFVPPFAPVARFAITGWLRDQ